MNNQPIGYIDSGVGGLTVVKQALEKIPNEQVIYLGDELHLPYGTKPAEEVITYTNQMADFLIAQHNIKLLVIACNTATARALPQVQARLAIPVIGVIPSGAAKALSVTQNNAIGIIATPSTVDSNAYAKALQSQTSEQLELTQLAVPTFVELVEDHFDETDLIQTEVAKQLAPLQARGIDTLILGCTHFPLLRDYIQAELPEVTLVGAGLETVDTVVAQLKQLSLAAGSGEKPTDIYYTSGDQQHFQQLAQRWLACDGLTVRSIGYSTTEGFQQ